MPGQPSATACMECVEGIAARTAPEGNSTPVPTIVRNGICHLCDRTSDGMTPICETITNQAGPEQVHTIEWSRQGSNQPPPGTSPTPGRADTLEQAQLTVALEVTIPAAHPVRLTKAADLEFAATHDIAVAELAWGACVGVLRRWALPYSLSHLVTI